MFSWTKVTLLKIPSQVHLMITLILKNTMVLCNAHCDAVLATLLRIPKFSSLRNSPVSDPHGKPGTKHLLETNYSQATG